MLLKNLPTRSSKQRITARTNQQIRSQDEEMQTNKEDFKEHTTTAVDSMDKKHSATTNDEECNRENADIDADQSAANMDVVNDTSGGQYLLMLLIQVQVHICCNKNHRRTRYCI
jgi:hypothetical protein